MDKTETLYGSLRYGEQFKGKYPYGTDSDALYTYPSFSRTRSGVTTPGFKGVVKNRSTTRPTDMPMNYYSDAKMAASNPTQTIYFRQNSDGKVGLEYGTFSPIAIPSVEAKDAQHVALLNKCIQKIPSKMNGTNFNIPLFLKDAAQTIDMVLNAAKYIRVALQRMSVSGGRPLHDLELEFRYGWRLLAKDIVDALNAIHDTRIAGIKSRVSASAFSASEGSYYLSDVGTLSGYYRPSCDVKVKYTERRDAKLTLWYTDESPLLGTLQQYGITNPLGVIYDAVPLSFVLDWFTPVGDYLRELDVYIGKSFLKGCVSYSTHRAEEWKPTNIRFKHPYSSLFTLIQAGELPASSGYRRAYVREPLTSFPSLNLPLIDVNLNAWRIADAFALIRQRTPAKLLAKIPKWV